MTDNTISKRDAAVVLLRLGMANLSEVARLAGVDRQLAAYWAKAAEIDPAESRETFLQSNWERALHGVLRVRKPRR